jgi:hypothetical protein
MTILSSQFTADPAGRAFDVVIAGQAWHWVDQVTLCVTSRGHNRR